MTTEMTLLLVGTGVVTALPLIWFSAAAKRINLSTLGFFQYIGPTCNFFLAVYLYGESFSVAHLWAFGFVWAGLILYTWGGFRKTRARSISTTSIKESTVPEDSISWYAKRISELAELGSSDTKQLDGVLLDDNQLNRLNWKHDAKKAGKSLLTFSSVEEFLGEIATISRETPLFLDRHLDGGVKGDDLAKYLKSDLDFQEIYITTGDPSDRICPPWANGVIGKRAPWRAVHA